VFCTEDAAETIEMLPSSVRDRIVHFLVDLAKTSGAAIDLGIPPQGSPMDDMGVQFSVTGSKPPAIIAYTVIADIREFRVTAVVPLLPEDD
jgi:hypothetical protein